MGWLVAIAVISLNFDRCLHISDDVEKKTRSKPGVAFV